MGVKGGKFQRGEGFNQKKKKTLKLKGAMKKPIGWGLLGFFFYKSKHFGNIGKRFLFLGGGFSNQQKTPTRKKRKQ